MIKAIIFFITLLFNSFLHAESTILKCVDSSGKVLYIDDQARAPARFTCNPTHITISLVNNKKITPVEKSTFKKNNPFNLNTNINRAHIGDVVGPPPPSALPQMLPSN